MRDGRVPLASGILGNVDLCDQCALLVTRQTAEAKTRRLAYWISSEAANAPLLTRKRDEELVTAIRTAHPGKPLAWVAALQVVKHRLADHGSPKAVSGMEALGIDLLELLAVFLQQPVQRRIPRLARTIERGILTVDDAHRELLKIDYYHCHPIT
jgi:hypothetical protein